MFSHTFCLLICRHTANTTEWLYMQISRNIVNGPKSSNQVLVGIRVIVCVKKPSHHFLQTFRPLRMFTIVFHDSSLYPKPLHLFCLLRLISASANPIWAVVTIEAFRHLIMFQQGIRKTKSLLDFYE